MHGYSEELKNAISSESAATSKDDKLSQSK